MQAAPVIFWAIILRKFIDSIWIFSVFFQKLLLRFIKPFLYELVFDTSDTQLSQIRQAGLKHHLRRFLPELSLRFLKKRSTCLSLVIFHQFALNVFNRFKYLAYIPNILNHIQKFQIILSDNYLGYFNLLRQNIVNIFASKH